MNRIDLDGRAAAVTGGATGIGYATVARLLDSGAAVAVWDRDTARLEETRRTLGNRGRLETIEMDVSKPETVAEACARTVGEFGKIDILVNSAGIGGANRLLWETPIEEWRHVVEVDLNGTFYCCRAVVPHMIENGYGRIVNIASIAGKEGNPRHAHYSAAKAGVIGLTKSLGKETVNHGILVNCIAPAVIETPILEQNTPEQNAFMISKIPLGRMGQPAEVAALIAWLCSEDMSFSTGAVYDISGGRATY